jgi:uncharacterized protein
MSRDILMETIACVRSRLGDLDGIVVERAVVGLFFSGVKLSTGHAGSAATPIKDIPEAVCCPSSAMAMPFPGKLTGRRAAALMEEAVDSTGVRRALGIAALNALAQAAAESGALPETEVLRDMDAFDAAEIDPTEKVVVVGAFAPFLRSLRQIGADYLVLEKDPATLKPVEMPFFRPAELAPEVIPQADVLLITGTTLINESLDRLLALAKPTARIAIVGPTVTMMPDAFFRRGCDILGGVEITDPDAFLDVISEGGSGYHFFGKSARKIVLTRPKVLYGSDPAKIRPQPTG